MKNLNLTISPWSDYELLDSGNNRKLERFGKFILIRPETQAIWESRRPELWKKADAEFVRSGEKGEWRSGAKKLPESWELAWHDITFSVRLTLFKHTGVFPEQAANWEWLREKVHALDKPNVLNLFGYTGIATAVAAKHGAKVTHVDASKQSNTWAKENAERSGVPAGAVRFLLDDALKFVEREVRRGAVYDGIILDPPAFGRGAKGEVWHIEEHLPKLLASLEKIFSKKSGAFFLLNGYAAGYSPQSFLQAIEGVFPEKISAGLPSVAFPAFAAEAAALAEEAAKEGEFGELHIPESNSKRVIPAGIYVRFVR